MKYLYIVLLAVFLVGCGDPGVSTSNYTNIIKNDPDLKGCVVKTVDDGKGNHIHITRCPSSTSTDYASGKTRQTSIFVNNVDIDLELATIEARKNELIARKSALSKLSVEEKELLGVK